MNILGDVPLKQSGPYMLLREKVNNCLRLLIECKISGNNGFEYLKYTITSTILTVCPIRRLEPASTVTIAKPEGQIRAVIDMTRNDPSK